ncbi:MAG: hypothetical protein ACREMD_03625 [Gemmatimonadota bacterium]
MRDGEKFIARLSEALSGGLVSVPALVALLGSPTVVAAQDIVPELRPLEVNIHVSALFLGDPQISDRADPAMGARVIYNQAGLALGGSFDWARQGFDAHREDIPGPLFLVNDVLFYSGEVGYTFGSGSRVQYFLVGGLGGATIRQAEREPGNDIRSETFLHIPIGGGLKVLDSPYDSRFALRIDMRDHIVWIGEPENREVFLRNEGAIDNVELSAGISFFFRGQ